MRVKLFVLSLICTMLLAGCSKSEQLVSNQKKDEDTPVEAEVKNKTLYEQFLDNKAPVTISSHVDHGEYFAFDKYEGKELTLEELVNAIIADYIGDDDTVQIWLEKIEYAYIDCGADGLPELALHIMTPMKGESWNEYIIIKEFDGKLKTVYSDVAWSRNFIFLNEYGYIYGDGSGGAAYHAFSKSYVDGEGKWHYIYSDTTELIAISEEYNGIGASTFHELSSEDIKKYKGEYILIDFDFNTPDYFNYGTSSEGDNIHSYGKLIRDDGFLDSDSGYRGYCYCNLEDDDSIYGEDSPLLKYYGGDGFYTLAEIEKMIADKESEVGLNDTIKNGADVDWKDLDINFEPYISTFNSDNFLDMKAYFPVAFSLSKPYKGTATRFTVSRDGSIEGNYNDYDSETRITTINEFTARFTDVKKIDDYSYSLTMSDLVLKYTPNTEGYETLPNGYKAYRKYITPYGLEDKNAVHYILYIPGTPVSSLDDGLLKKINDFHLKKIKENNELDDYILFNTETDKYCVWISY